MFGEGDSTGGDYSNEGRAGTGNYGNPGDYSNEGRNYGTPIGSAPGNTQSPGGGWNNDDQSDAETGRLNQMELGQLGLGGVSPGTALNKSFLESLFEPGSMAYRMGLRAPGTTASQMFDTETAEERADRLSLVGQAIDSTFGTVARMAMPAPVSLALGLYNGYQDYQQNQDPRSALAAALGGQRGVLGALGAVAQGNYGSALSGALTGRTDPLSAGLAGAAVDAAQGKNVQRGLGGLFGGWAGNRLGGPIGGVVGSRVGRGLSGMF